MSLGNLLRANTKKITEDLNYNRKMIIEKKTIEFQKILEDLFPEIKKKLISVSLTPVSNHYKHFTACDSSFVDIDLKLVLSEPYYNELINIGIKTIKEFFNKEDLTTSVTVVYNNFGIIFSTNIEWG